LHVGDGLLSFFRVHGILLVQHHENPACRIGNSAQEARLIFRTHVARDGDVQATLDELADLPRVSNMERLLPQGRKFGACAILSFQTIGQMRGHYGSDGAEALLGCCNTKLFLQMSDHASREWAAATIGSVEVEIPTLAEMFDPKTGKPQRTLSTMRELRAAVLESDLRLPKHTGYLLLPDGLPVARIKLTNDHIIARGPARQPDFIPADVSETLWGGLQEAQKAKAAEAPDAPIQGTILGPGPV
jgi:hypothetical protein